MTSDRVTGWLSTLFWGTCLAAAAQTRATGEMTTASVRIGSGRGSVPCRGIHIARSRPWQQVHDERAAGQLKRYIHAATSEELPVVYLEDAQAVEPGMIVIGQAARSVIPRRTLESLKPGGYAIHVKDGIAGVAGTRPAGVTTGTFAFIEKILDITFITGQSLLRFKTEPEIHKRGTVVVDEMSVASSPRFELRYAMHGLAIGYTDELCWGDERRIGQSGHHRWHVMGSFLDFGKHAEAHPEYFSRDSSGKMLSAPGDGVHACLSDPNGTRVVREAFLKWMKDAPEGLYYTLLQGDGRNMSCRCPDCRAMVERDGSYTDSWLRFVNSVARIAAREHPEKRVCTVAYVDTERPPVRTVPAANVIVFYAIYPPSWSNHLQGVDDEHNKTGMENLAGWIKSCPGRLCIEEYPISYAERLNIWPALYATVDRIRFYASQKGIKGVELCGFMPGWNCFSEMYRYVVSKVLWDPTMEVDEQIDSFMRLYYGPAAPPMRQFFDLVHKERSDRGLAMRCEGALRGLVTEEMAYRSYAMFDEAEKAAAGTQRYLDRVRFEKLFLLCTDLTDRCLANGRIGEEQVPEYAKRLAEFAALAGKRWKKDDFARRVPAQKWFWQTAFIKITSPLWYEDPALEALVERPVETVDELRRKYAKGN